MNLKHLSHDNLINNAKSLSSQEREIGIAVLHHLHEIQTRGLHLERGYGSLFEFTTKELGYTEAAAGRRVAAMRLLFTLPKAESKQVEAALQSGELSLSTVSTLQRFISNEKKERQKSYSVTEKMALIAEVKNKSTRDVERVLAKVSPESAKPRDFQRAVTATDTVMRFTADAELISKLERLKEILSHQLPTHDLNTVLNKVADVALRALKQPPAKCPPTKPPQKQSEKILSPAAPQSDDPRYIPDNLRALKLNAAQDQCEYVDPRTNRRCTARHYLQIDHIKPVAHGGMATPTNLRVFCGAHNRWRATHAH